MQKVVVTSLVMRLFCILPGAPRACADFCDPTAVSRLKVKTLLRATKKHVSKNVGFFDGWDYAVVILVVVLAYRLWFMA